MSYHSNTPGNIQIPYISTGEVLSQQSELRAAQITENQLVGLANVTGTSGYLIISEGTYSSNFSAGGNTSVTLTTSVLGYTLQGLINDIYIFGKTNITWSNIPDSHTSYLYAQLVESNIYASNQQSSRQGGVFVTISNITGITPLNSILVGVITTSGSGITSFNTSSTASDNSLFSAGKPYYVSVTTHRTANPIDHPLGSVTSAHLNLTSGLNVIAGTTTLNGSLNVFYNSGINFTSDGLNKLMYNQGNGHVEMYCSGVIVASWHNP